VPLRTRGVSSVATPDGAQKGACCVVARDRAVLPEREPRDLADRGRRALA
jgi:hypothetical protein